MTLSASRQIPESGTTHKMPTELTSPNDMPPSSLRNSFTLQLPDGWQDHLPIDILPDDERKMKYVIGLAEWNHSVCKGGPFAAAVFHDESHELISIGVNRVVPDVCSLAHAEALAIGLAQQQLNTCQLASSGPFTLFASGQPCVQCFGMLWWSGLSRLVTAASAADIEELTNFDEGPLVANWQQMLGDRAPLNAVRVTEGVCRSEARAVLKSYQESGGDNYGPVVR